MAKGLSDDEIMKFIKSKDVSSKDYKAPKTKITKIDLSKIKTDNVKNTKTDNSVKNKVLRRTLVNTKPDNSNKKVNQTIYNKNAVRTSQRPEPKSIGSIDIVHNQSELRKTQNELQRQREKKLNPEGKNAAVETVKQAKQAMKEVGKATNKARTYATAMATNNDFRKKELAKYALSAGVGLSQLSKGAMKTVEHFMDAGTQVTDYTTNWIGHKLGIYDDDEYKRLNENTKKNVEKDVVGDFWKNNLGWDEENARVLNDYSYITEDNLGGQLTYGIGQQIPGIMLGSAGMNYMTKGGQIAANSIYAGLKGKKGLDLAKAATGNLAKAAIVNAPSNIEIGTRSFGGALEEAYKNGATPEQAMRYGIMNAGTEIATEWMTGGIPGLEETTGIFDKGVDTLIDKATGKIKNKYAKAITKSILNYGFEAAGEGFEEAVSEIVSPLLKNASYSKGEKVDWNQVLDAAIMGSIQAGILNAPSSVSNLRSDLRNASQLDQLAQQRVQQIDQAVRQGQMTAQEGTQEIENIQRYVDAQKNTLQQEQQPQQNQNNQLAQQAVQQINQQVQSGQISPQDGIQQIEDIQNYLRAQEAQAEQQQNDNLVQDYMNDNYESLVGDYIDENYGQQTQQDNINTQEEQNVAQNANNKVEQKPRNVGIHYGDLGKARDTYYWDINSSNRSTGHYGTGTYFLSEQESQRMQDSPFFSRRDRAKNEVDFNDYNLYKPLIEREARTLHDGLKAINYNNYDDFDYKIMVDDLKRHGITQEQIDNARNAVEETRERYKNEGYNDKYDAKMDSLSTVFMKALGYDGIDVRGLEGYDNTSYGSVIYDLKNKQNQNNAENNTKTQQPTQSNVETQTEQQQESNLVEDYMNNGEDNLVNNYMNNYEDGNMVENYMNAQNNQTRTQQENASNQNNIENAQEKEYNKTIKEEGVGNEFRRLQEESRRMSSKDTESFHSGQRQVDEGIRNRLSRVLGGRLQTGDGSLWNGNSSIVNKKTGKNIEILENVDPQTFKDTFEIVQKYLPNGDAVDVHDVKSSEYSTGYEDTKNFLSKDGLSGFAITKDGDLISVFNLGEKGYLKSIKDYVKKNGAKTLDCYQSEKQPLADMYNKTLGFKTASLMDFNYDILVEDKGKEYADYFVKTYGEAPVAFMIDTDQDVETKHFNKDQYDEALEYRNSYLKNEGTSDSSFSNEQTNIPETKTEPVAQILSEKPKEQKTKLREKFKNIKDEAYRLFVSNRAELERIAKVTNRPDIVFKHDKAQRYQAEANHHIAEEQTDLNYKPYNNFTNENGEKVTMSLDAIRKDAKNHNISEQTLNEYLAHNLNVDRYMEDKPVFGKSVTSEDSLKRIAEIEQEHPEIKRIAQNVWAYEHNELKNTYDSGRISKEDYDRLAKYEHYVRIQRNIERKGNNAAVIDKNGKISVNQGIQQAKGGNQDILPILETIAQRTVENTRANRLNEAAKELGSAISMGSEDSTISAIEDEESFGVNPDLFKQNDDGTYTMTFFNNGVATVVPINKAIYDAFVTNKYISALENNNLFKAVTYLPRKVSSMFRTLTTNDNPMFMVTNAFKDIGDAPFNSKYAKEFAEVYTSTQALREVAGNGGYNKIYNRAGGNSDSYFVDGEFKDKTQSKIGKTKDKLLTPIEKGNEVVETTPRMAEFIATIKANGYEVNSDGEMVLKDSKKANGRSAESVLDEALYNAAEVTTNFKRGGDLAKAINRNGGTFFNASIQGFDKQVRNFKDAFTSGDKKKIIALLTKALIFGVAPTMLNDAANDDDDEYKNMQDYLKDNYYLFKGKDGNYIRIPKGRAMSVIGSAYRRTKDLAGGEKDAFKGFTKFASGQVAPNNPFENNIVAPFFAVGENKSWSGNPIVSQTLEENSPTEERYTEKTDEFSKWLGKQLKNAPIPERFKTPAGINYLIDQYTGGAGDVLLPMITPKATSKTSNPLIQPFISKFTTDSVYQQKDVSKFYDVKKKLKQQKGASYATKENKVKSSYMESRGKELSALYEEQHEIQNDKSLSKKEKYEQAREVQKKINKFADESVKNVNDIKDHKYYATIGDDIYYLTIDKKTGKDIWSKDSYADSHKKAADKKGMALYDYYKEKYEERKAKKK